MLSFLSHANEAHGTVGDEAFYPLSREYEFGPTKCYGFSISFLASVWRNTAWWLPFLVGKENYSRVIEMAFTNNYKETTICHYLKLLQQLQAVLQYPGAGSLSYLQLGHFLMLVL